MSPFLEKLVSFFMIESPDPEEPNEAKNTDDAAETTAAPPVPRVEPVYPDSPAEPAQMPPVHRLDPADIEPSVPAKPAPAEKPLVPVPQESTAQSAQPAEPKSVEEAPLPKKRSAAKRTPLKKPAAAEPVPEAPVQAVQIPEVTEPEASAPEATAPEVTPAPEKSSDEARAQGGFRDKLKSFFFPSDEEDEDARLAMPETHGGRRPVGTRVRMASHSFTTVTEQDRSRHSDCLPLDGESRALLQLAKAVRKNAYAKYSGFKVGAALKAVSGQVYFGVNVENASYPAGICAERAAFTAAITAGERQFTAIAICGGDDTEPCFPCGICRQVLMELCPPDMPVILESGVYRLDSLLPHAFQFTNR